MDDRIWKCSTVGCANRTNGIKEDRFYSQVLSILMDVQADCSLLDKEAVLTEYKPNANVRKGENEVVMRCHIKPIDDERIKKEIISLAALKYDCCTYDISKYLTEEIKKRLSICEPTQSRNGQWQEYSPTKASAVLRRETERNSTLLNRKCPGEAVCATRAAKQRPNKANIQASTL